MRILLGLCVAAVLSAQAPNLSGVWKAVLEKSKFAGPPPSNYLEILEPAGVDLSETIGAWGPRGQQRSTLRLPPPASKPAIATYQGVPARFTTALDGAKLVLTVDVAGRPSPVTNTYEVSSDGHTLTISSHAVVEGRERQSLIVLAKQPDAAGDPLRQPEELAAAHFKNVKTPMKDLPASQFIDRMRYFTWALGQDCEFCHVQRQFDSDDKKEKRTAREMIEMTTSIDQNSFKGKPEVQCYTCHQGHEHPQSRPLFPGEPPHQHPADKD